MAKVITFTDAESGQNIHIIKEKIIAFRDDKLRPNTINIFTNFPAPFLVSETLDEIYKAIYGLVDSEPTNDFVDKKA